jgi:hypothetical protein
MSTVLTCDLRSAEAPTFTFSELGYYVHTETIATTLKAFCKTMAPIYALVWLLVGYARQLRHSKQGTRLLVRLGLYVDDTDAELSQQALIEANSYQNEPPMATPPLSQQEDVSSELLLAQEAKELIASGLNRRKTAKQLGTTTYKLNKLLRLNA